MLVKVIKNFNDTTNNLTLRKAGEELEVDEARAIVLIDAGVAVKVEEKKVEATEEKPVVKPTRRRAR